MSIDKYYNNHSIKILNDNNLTIEAEDAAISCEGKIHIRADGEEGLRLTGAGSSILIDDQTASHRMITYTSQVHKFKGTYTNDTAFYFEYPDSATGDVFEIKMTGRDPDFVVDNNGAITFHRSVYFKNGDPQEGKVLTTNGTSGIAEWKYVWQAFDFDEQYLQNPTFYVESGSYTVDTTPAGSDSGFVEFVAPKSIRFTVAQGEYGSHSLWLQDDNQVKVTGPTGPQREGILLVENQSSSGEQIGIEIELSSSATNGQASWISFQDHNNEIRGCIKTTADYGDGVGFPFMYIDPVVGGQRTVLNSVGYQYATSLIDIDDDGDEVEWVQDSVVYRITQNPAVTGAGMAMFLSGGADFGEFFHAGDASEWPDEWGTLKVKRDLKENAKFLNIPEGLLVWVRENRFYRQRKDNNCIPMLVTKRAVVVGDARPLLAKSSEGFVGEILSFCGKLPAIVRGAASSGDYLVPVPEEGFCRAVSCDAITFEEYRQSIGRALSTTDQVGDDDLSLVLCAVGVK